VERSDPDPIAALARRAGTAGLRAASLDEVLCVRLTEKVRPGKHSGLDDK
jgi:hypothetical protein